MRPAILALLVLVVAPNLGRAQTNSPSTELRPSLSARLSAEYEPKFKIDDANLRQLFQATPVELKPEASLTSRWTSLGGDFGSLVKQTIAKNWTLFLLGCKVLLFLFLCSRR